MASLLIVHYTKRYYAFIWSCILRIMVKSQFLSNLCYHISNHQGIEKLIHQPTGIKQISSRFVIKVITHILELRAHTQFGLWKVEVSMSVYALPSLQTLYMQYSVGEFVRNVFHTTMNWTEIYWTVNSYPNTPYASYEQKIRITVSPMSLQISL